jgi:glycosyltransferase involved in cell wall biosynthesis
MVTISPRISVVLPTYRRTTYLRGAITTALSQTFRDLELFISDNSDDDAVEMVVREFDDPRIRYRRNDRNLGGTENFLRAVADASCEVVACLHDDDEWAPHFLERVGQPLVEDVTLTLGCCDFTLVDSQGRPLQHETADTERHRHRRAGAGRLDLADPEAMAAVLADGLVQPAYNSVFRRSLVTGRTMPDALEPLYDLWIRELLCRDRSAILFVAERLTSYRIHTDSQTAQRSFLPQAADAYEGYLRDAAFAPIAEALREFLVEGLWHLAGEYLRDGDEAAFRRELARAAPNTRGAKAVWLRMLGSLGPATGLLRKASILQRARHDRRR